MRSTEVLKARVSSEIKLRAKAVADRHLLTESAWLRRLVSREIRATEVASQSSEESLRSNISLCPDGPAHGERGSKRVYLRLCLEDWLLLQARSEARGLRPATYLAVLTRSHLRSITPLPKAELLALKRSIAELGSIGRNINQIARAQWWQFAAELRI